ncbi:MAG TPA: hypothetical protein VGQ84_07780 [Gaiellaceae bacterium]|jgi:hypothetical protein|nr:hypothetical protein [Gaiellaceae bacterium]
MRTLCATAVAVVLAAFVAGDALTAPNRPVLRLAKLQPLTVVGRSFPAGERVRVRVLAPVTAFRWTRADRNGSFTVRFGDIPATRCDVIRVIAVGSGGSRVVLKELPAPACSPG